MELEAPDFSRVQCVWWYHECKWRNLPLLQTADKRCSSLGLRRLKTTMACNYRLFLFTTCSLQLVSENFFFVVSIFFVRIVAFRSCVGSLKSYGVRKVPLVESEKSVKHFLFYTLGRMWTMDQNLWQQHANAPSKPSIEKRRVGGGGWRN